jgi:glycosyltransferase involved in cell wall biosynthesis
MPKFSVITVCLNEPQLERTCKSIVSQSFQDFEWIVIDGGSDKRAQDIFTKYKYRMTYFVSEKDGGKYAALNKGIVQARGKWLNFMNSGDMFYNNDVLQFVNETIDKTEDKPHVFYANDVLEIGDQRILSNMPSTVTGYFMYKSSLRHQATFIDSTSFDIMGMYDESLKVVSDYKWFLLAMKKGLMFKRITDYPLAIMDGNGISTSPMTKPIQIAEHERIKDELFSTEELAEFAVEEKKKIALVNAEKLRLNILYGKPVFKKSKTKKYKMLFQADMLLRGQLNKSERTGIYFVTQNLLEQFEKDKRFEITLALFFNQIPDDILAKFKQNERYGKFPIIRFYRNIRIKNIVKTIINPVIKNTDYDFCFSSLGGNLPRIQLPCFGMLHDIIPFLFAKYYAKAASQEENDFYQLTKRCLTRSNFYFCVSNSCKKDYLKYFSEHLDPGRMFVMPNATMRSFSPQYNADKLSTLFNRYGVSRIGSKKYILSLCTVEPRKNIPFTIGCFSKFIAKHHIDDLFFVIAGGSWDFVSTSIRKSLDRDLEEASATCRNKVIRLGYVLDEDAEILYSHALAFTFISEYEGFGMPPLEAMSCGTPVITSNTSSLPEVVGDAAITIDPHDEKACIKAFENLYFNAKLCEEYSKRGFERAKMFSWEKTAELMTEKILQVYNK